jgi:hypothetical protein
MLVIAIMQGDTGLSKSQKKRMKKKASAAAKENEDSKDPTGAGKNILSLNGYRISGILEKIVCYTPNLESLVPI